MLVRIVVRSKVRGEELVLMVQTVVRVFLQKKYMDGLEKKYVLKKNKMIGDFEDLLAFFEVFGTLSAGTGVEVVD